jgi:hypothetical protein
MFCSFGILPGGKKLLFICVNANVNIFCPSCYFSYFPSILLPGFMFVSHCYRQLLTESLQWGLKVEREFLLIAQYSEWEFLIILVQYLVREFLIILAQYPERKFLIILVQYSERFRNNLSTLFREGIFNNNLSKIFRKSRNS